MERSWSRSYREKCTKNGFFSRNTSVENDCNFTHHVGYRAKGNPEEAVQQLVKDLMEKDVCNTSLVEKVIPHFLNLHKLNYRDFHA